jgi:casein kinase I family protein HRR25
MLGKNLESIVKKCNNKFSTPTLLKLAIQVFVIVFFFIYQILNRIETLHNLRFIHRDIKPDNFVLGTSN